MVTTFVVTSRRPCPFAIVRLGRAGDSPRRHEVHEDFLGMARGGFTTKARRARSFCRGWFWWLVVGGWWLVVGGWWLSNNLLSVLSVSFRGPRRAPNFVPSRLRVKPAARHPPKNLRALGGLCGEPDARQFPRSPFPWISVSFRGPRRAPSPKNLRELRVFVLNPPRAEPSVGQVGRLAIFFIRSIYGVPSRW